MTVTEHELVTDRHTSFYMAAGSEENIPVIFCHGWPELSLTWRSQIEPVAALGFYAVAPDMRGYGRSTIHTKREDYRMEAIVGDMIELLDSLGAEKAIWIGHDWGAGIVWSIAQQHPDRCHGVANICVPYFPTGLSEDALVKTVDRRIYPAQQFPHGQWDYWRFYQENFDLATKGFEQNVQNTVHTLFRSVDPSFLDQPSMSASISMRGGWFGPDGAGAPPLPRDEKVLSEEEAKIYIMYLEKNGFFGPDAWYVNGEENRAYTEKVRDNWILDIPVHFVHAKYDNVCTTAHPAMSAPMREHCPQLTESVVDSSHWVAQENPKALAAALTGWINSSFLHLSA